MSDDKPFNVTSYNQQGGITAGQVNIQPGDRVLNPETAKALEEALKSQKFISIVVTSVMGDGEAFQFASQIKAYLESKGYKVGGVNQALYSVLLHIGVAPIRLWLSSFRSISDGKMGVSG